jgi:hypothetical protein
MPHPTMACSNAAQLVKCIQLHMPVVAGAGSNLARYLASVSICCCSMCDFHGTRMTNNDEALLGDCP